MGATAPSAAAPSYLRVKAQRGMRPADEIARLAANVDFGQVQFSEGSEA
jgi:hypothetical protein